MPPDQDEFFAKAQEGLAAAEAALEAGWFTVCARTAYFAAYHAAVAVLLHEGIRDRKGEWTHVYVLRSFAERLVNRRRLYLVQVKADLAWNMGLRHLADYRATPISRGDAAKAVWQSWSLLLLVEYHLKSDSR